MKYNKTTQVEKAAVDAETARYKMKQQEYQAKQNDYQLKMQAQQQAMQPQQPVQPQPIQPINPAPQPMPDSQLQNYAMPKPKRTKKKPLTLRQEMDKFGERHGGWTKGVTTKAEEKRWKRKYG